MIAALIFQSTSLLVGVLSVPLFLSFLSASDFLAWIVIATFGALTIQLELSLQIVSVRRMARAWHSGDEGDFRREVRAATWRYLLLATGVIIVIGPFGFIYFTWLTDIAISGPWPLAWGIFVLTYALNYAFGRNSCILLSTAQTDFFNLSNAASRIINFALTSLLLYQGFAILGITVSFLLSVLINVAVIGMKARRVMQEPVPERAEATGGFVAGRVRDVIGYTAFTVAAFMLYKGAFLVAPVIVPNADLGSYGLLIQIAAIIYTISVIPAQVRLSHLTRATLDRDKESVRASLVFSIGFLTLTFVSVFVGLVLFAGPARSVINSEISLPAFSNIALVFCALAIEACIFTLVNFLVVCGDYRFVWRYVPAALFALAVGISLRVRLETHCDRARRRVSSMTDAA